MVKLSQEEIVKLTIDLAFNQLLEEPDGTSYKEQAKETCGRVLSLIEKIEKGEELYEEPDFLYCGEEDSDEDLEEE